MKITSIIAYILVIIGALVWLLVGIFDFNLVSFIFGAGSTLSRIVYSAVGVAGLYLIFFAICYRPFHAVG